MVDPRQVSPIQEMIIAKHSRMVGKVLDLIDASMPEGVQCEKFKKLVQVPLYDFRNEMLYLQTNGIPEDTGELKKSAYTQYKGTKKKLRGWSVVFDAPYAASVEEGRVSSGIPNYDMKVKRHKRRLASGKTVNVKAHVKKYSDFNKPVLIGGNEWRIVQDTDRPGVHFLRDAWKNVRNRVKDRKLRKMLPKTLNKEMIK